jgi:hypothetical protein
VKSEEFKPRLTRKGPKENRKIHDSCISQTVIEDVKRGQLTKILKKYCIKTEDGGGESSFGFFEFPLSKN